MQTVRHLLLTLVATCLLVPWSQAVEGGMQEADEDIPFPVTGETPDAHAQALRPWLIDRVPAVTEDSPALQPLLWFLARHIRSRDNSPLRIDHRYWNRAVGHFSNYLAVERAIDSGLPDAYRNDLLAWYAWRLIPYRVPVDAGAEARWVSGIPAGGTLIETESATQVQAAIADAYPDLVDLPPTQAHAWLHRIAAINPTALLPDGTYWLPDDSSVDEDRLHAVLTEANRLRVTAWRVNPGRPLYLPPATHLRRLRATAIEPMGDAAVEQTTYHLRIADYRNDEPAHLVITTRDGRFDNGYLIQPNRTTTGRPLQLAEPPAPEPGGHDVFPLTFNGAYLTGYARVQVGQDGRRAIYSHLVFDVDLRGGSGRVEVDGRVRLVSAATPPTTDPIAAEATWPMWLGPTMNGSADPMGHDLIGSLDQAPLAWISDDDTPDGRGQDTRGNPQPLPVGAPVGGGWATPVVADNRVILSYYEPSGDAYGDGAEPRSDADRERLRLNRILADDVIHCFDATTGETLWRRVFPRSGMNWGGFNKSGPKLTPAIVGDRVVALGTLGDVWCVSLEDGAVLWHTDIGLRADLQRQERAVQLATSDVYGTRNDFECDVIVADGVVVLSDQIRTKRDYRYERRSGLIGLDLTTGR